MSEEESDDLVFDTLWNRALEAWEDDAVHAKVLDYSLRSEKLPLLAGRYRAIADEDAEKRERAQKKLDGIVVAATQMLFATKSPEPARPSRTFTIVVALICAGVVVWLGLRIVGR